MRTGRELRSLPLLLALAAALSGCGLLGAGSGELGFRTYPLPDVPYAEAVQLVPDVVRQFYAERFTGAGGFSLDWDPVSGNLRASPVIAGDRRMRLYLVIEPAGAGTQLELFALVETLDEASVAGPQWTRPMQDVPLEEQLYEVILAEHLRRRDG